MDTVKEGISLGLILFVILLITVSIMRRYTDMANTIGEKIRDLIKCLWHKVRGNFDGNEK